MDSLHLKSESDLWTWMLIQAFELSIEDKLEICLVNWRCFKSLYGIILVFKAHFHYNFEGPGETLSARLQYSSN